MVSFYCSLGLGFGFGFVDGLDISTTHSLHDSCHNIDIDATNSLLRCIRYVIESAEEVVDYHSDCACFHCWQSVLVVLIIR